MTLDDLPARWRARIAANDAGGCWLWSGWNSGDGYGKTRVRGRAMMAHRAVFLHAGGVIPTRFVLDHLCRNRACVNPAHLEAVPPGTNTARGEAILFRRRA